MDKDWLGFAPEAEGYLRCDEYHVSAQSGVSHKREGHRSSIWTGLPWVK